MANKNLTLAKNKKDDEFYTQWIDIEKEVQAYLEYDPDVFKDKIVLCPCDDPEWSNFTKFFAQNFNRFGLKKLISTSYAHESKKYNTSYQVSFFEKDSPKFDETKTKIKGKIFILDKDSNSDKNINIEDLQWEYMNEDGDFRSKEVLKLRDNADIIITNPPFSLFREFMAWILEAKKEFLILGNMNAITYKEIFPLIKDNKVWLGKSPRGMDFKTDTGEIKNVNAAWYTNLEHGRRHQPIPLMTMEDNLKHSRHKEIRGKTNYEKYDNYDAIEVPFVDAIPSDYEGVMGVPISFLDKYSPEQFKIVGITAGRDEFEARPIKRYINPVQINKNGVKTNGSKANTRSTLLLKYKPKDCIYYTADNVAGYLIIVYARILIKHKK